MKIYDNGILYSFYGLKTLLLRCDGEPVPKTLFRNPVSYDHVVLEKEGIDYDVVVDHEGQKIPVTMNGIVFSRHTLIDDLEKDLVSGNYVFFYKVDDAILYTENKFLNALQYAYKYTHLKSVGDAHFFEAEIDFALQESEIFAG